MSKSDRVDRMYNELWTEDDVAEKLREVQVLSDDDLRNAVVETFVTACPKSFWDLPSSSTGKYHPPKERGKHGNVIHTKRVFAVLVDLTQPLVEMDIINRREQETALAAALIHDMMKYGWPSEMDEHTVDHHDLVAEDVARNLSNLPDEVCDMVNRHMGVYGEGNEPETRLEQELHQADRVASHADNRIGILFTNDDIEQEWPNVLTRDVDSPEEVLNE